MSQLIVTSSSNISILDSRITTDLCSGKFYIDLTPSTFIGVGADNALGAKVRITNPYNVKIKDYSTAYDIAAPFTGVFEFNISTAGGNFEYGQFTIDVQITDADNKTYTVTKTVEPSYPDSSNRSRKYGILGASIKAVCQKGVVYVAIDTLPTYRGIIAGGVSQNFEFDYPTVSGVPKATRTLSYFSEDLFEGVYRIKGDVCATYNGADNISYKVPYKVDYKKEVLCQIDECAVLSNLVQIDGKLNATCSEEQQLHYASLTVDVLRLLKTAQLANECGEDASDYIKQLEELLPGLRCSEDLGKAPIVNSVPASSIVIEGCNIEESVDGLTRHYKFNNYTYVVKVAENGGFLTASNAQIDGCTSTQTLTFDIAKVYAQVKTYANQDITEANFWASVVNKSITSATPPVGITQNAWNAMTFIQRVQAIINRIEAVQASMPAAVTIPDIPPTPTFNNGVTVITPRSGTTPAVVGLGSPLVRDTTIDGGYRLTFSQARVGIGKVPVFPFEVQLTDPNFNLASQVTMAMPLANGKARLATFSALQILGVAFTANQSNQAAAVTGQTVFYNSGLHQLNQYTNYAGTVGILIGFANGTVTGSVISALSAITMVGNGGSYNEIAGLRITAPQGSNFPDAADFSGTVNNYYSICIDLYSPASFPDGQITNRWGLYQKGNESHRFGGKIVWDATLNAGTGNVTVNKPAGTFLIPAGSTSATVTNNMVTTSSMVHVQLGSTVVVGDNPPTAPAITVVALEANGSFTAVLSAAQSVPMKIKFIVYN